MRDFEAIADRVEIEALRGEFTDAVMMRDYDRVASLFPPDGGLRIPYAARGVPAASAALCASPAPCAAKATADRFRSEVP